jgi:hypothetical protein
VALLHGAVGRGKTLSQNCLTPSGFCSAVSPGAAASSIPEAGKRSSPEPELASDHLLRWTSQHHVPCSEAKAQGLQ